MEWIVEANDLDDLCDGKFAIIQRLIRCRDCKYNSSPPDVGNATCDTFYGMTDQFGFCHMGERREDE